MAEQTDPNVQTTVTGMQKEEVDALIAKARQQEKDKLYSEITNLKADIEKLNAKITESTSSLAEKDSAITEKDKEIKKLEGKITKMENEGAVINDKAVKALEEKISALEVKDVAREAEMEKIKKQAEVDKYRLDKIKDLDESVHDLVFGVSNEEVDKTYDKAKVAFEKMQAKLGAISLPRPKQNSMNLKEMNQASMEEMHNIQTPEQWAEFKKKNNIK